MSDAGHRKGRAAAAICVLLVYVSIASPSSAANQGISGRVTNRDRGPVQGLCVVVSSPLGSGSAITDDDGRYSISLEPAAYTVWFTECGMFFPPPERDERYRGEYFDDAESADTATPVPVVPGLFTKADAVLRRLGSVSGRVTDATGNPLAGICALVVDVENPGIGALGKTGADGAYEAHGLANGRYKVRFDDCQPDGVAPEYLSEWYRDSATADDATAIRVHLDRDTPSVDAVLTRGGSISGVLSTEAGTPPSRSCAIAYRDGEIVAGILSGADGSYRLSGLEAGDYKVRFGFQSCGSTHAPEWYDDAPEEESATILPVAVETDLVGIDAVLAPEGFITGRVTDENGAPVPNLFLGAFEHPERTDGTTDDFIDAVAGGTTEADGTYTLRGLGSRSYKVKFNLEGLRPYRIEWYDDRPDFGSATPVPVSPGAVTADIDAVLAPGAVGGCPLDGGDTDGDGLSDCEEAALRLDPLDPDTDGDLFSDGIERDGGECLGVPTFQRSRADNPQSTPYGTVETNFFTAEQTDPLKPIC